MSLEPIRQLRIKVDAWPLIAHPATPEEQRINAILRRLNEHMMKALKDCDAYYREDRQLTDTAKGEWERKITITMNGPRFLSMVVEDSYIYCGGAHPDSGTLAMVFDLTTGKPINWMRFIAKSANARVSSDFAADGSTVGTLIFPGLRAITLARTDKECRNVFEAVPMQHQLWPDAKRGKLITEAFDVPHAYGQCGDEIALTMDQARKLGLTRHFSGPLSRRTGNLLRCNTNCQSACCKTENALHCSFLRR